tara:strand:+ start:2410 stop:3633 length:1224 start_codon:yes stop_codon:yes gene_type:complete
MNIISLKKKINPNQKIILFGAGRLGKLALNALQANGLDVYAFYDSSEYKQGEEVCNTKILDLNELSALEKTSIIFITNNYISYVQNFLRKLGFKNIYDCIHLFDEIKKIKINQNLNEYDINSIDREISFHKSAIDKSKIENDESLHLKCIDIVVTEKCSMKCKDCSNLMQYYERPQNSDLNLMFETLDKFMSCLDSLYEFRVLGGDPFMNKELHKTIEKLKEYKNAQNIVVYTNATIIPKNENFECLKDDKITIEITNYGKDLSRKHDELVELLNLNKIKYRSRPPGDWNACGTLKFYERSEKELQRVFDNCCMSDVTTMMDGILFRCPFAANATKLKAVPYVENEVINLNHDITDKDNLKKKIKNFNNNKKPLTACSYCGGRDYSSEIIKPAIQTKKPLEYIKIEK